MGLSLKKDINMTVYNLTLAYLFVFIIVLAVLTNIDYRDARRRYRNVSPQDSDISLLTAFFWPFSLAVLIVSLFIKGE